MQKAGLFGQTIAFQVKTSDFQRHSRQLSLATLTDQAAAIESAAIRLADELLPGLFRDGASIRLIGVGVSKLSGNENRQLDLVSWAAEKQELEKDKEQKQKQEKLDRIMKEMDSRYGSGTIRRGLDPSGKK